REGTRFAETYRGHRIVGARYDAGRSRGDGSGTWHVTVDGRPLHLMRRADGSWMTMVDHYASYSTPLAAARGAVDELGPTARLRTPDDHGGHGRGSISRRDGGGGLRDGGGGRLNGGGDGRRDGSGTPSGSKGAERDQRRGVHP
ncbi:hypothetical protein FNH04_45940, partial [Streptomyces phyllanthi]